MRQRTADSFYVEFLNDLGNWVQVYAREGTPLVDFFPVTVGLDGAPSGGGTYFYSQFPASFPLYRKPLVSLMTGFVGQRLLRRCIR